MKTKDIKKLKEKNIEELQKEVVTLKQQRDRAHADISAGKEGNLKKARNLRKEIAQYLTVIREKEMEVQK